MRERICRMICSTSTLSERIEKSDMVCSFRRSLLVHELRRLGDARTENTERPYKSLRPGQRDLGARGAHVRVAIRRGRDRLPVAEQPSPRAVEDVLHHLLR